jgi:hypothetical protein
MLGNNEDAYRYLKEVNEMPRITIADLTYLKNNPLFNSLRNEAR